MKKEVEELQKSMKDNGIDCYIIPTGDCHNSEYVSDYDKVREYISGFTGSNGILLVTGTEAKLWTDGRYFIQAKRELEGSGIEMMKMNTEGCPGIWEYVSKLYSDGVIKSIGFNGNQFTVAQYEDIMTKCADGIEVITDTDLAGELFNESGNRPSAPANRVKLLDAAFTGRNIEEKLGLIREDLKENKCHAIFLNKLEDIMWLYNLRGSDIKHCPVALSFAFVDMDYAYIFLKEEALSEAVKAYLASFGVIICDYEDVYVFLADYPYSGEVLVDDRNVSVNAYRAITKAGAKVFLAPSPVELRRAVKNETEIKWIREYFLRDSVAMTKYIFWLKEKVCNCTGELELTEYDCMQKCDELRLSQDGCMDISFDTIVAYGSNAAMMHYSCDEKNSAAVLPQGMLLTDCGGQYPGATTDVTRTVAMGEVSDEERTAFTRVLKGFLALMNAKWLKGCTGRNLDILARGPLWQHGIDYKCGTGHGVGCCLNVHEGPQAIRWVPDKKNKEAELVSGMLITDEPGVYVENKYGIRTENTLLVREYMSNEDGDFLCFENLTFVPIDMELVDMSLLNPDELEMLRHYQQEVYDKLKDYLDMEELDYVKRQIP